MLDVLRDLYAHMAWADAVHWHVILERAAASSDPEIRQRLHHITTVQRAFHALFRGEAPGYADLDPATATDALCDEAVAFHAAAAAFVARATPEALTQPIDVPWFREPPLRLPTGEAMLQVALHTQHHRGQNATRLRQLGFKPPTTDLIVWYWKGRPAPRWERPA